ncbi:hypothetical protein P43SY_002992 [Pythium insidiosum]|uniref:Uncharacterized protein n=1 Tax=Pythium insidiosum TaxID=114742 RepID=A0AAD5LUR1_PYTIN|nr:hypothetical protein P43SY_002992 [Pythium insidiosum]
MDNSNPLPLFKDPSWHLDRRLRLPRPGNKRLRRSNRSLSHRHSQHPSNPTADKEVSDNSLTEGRGFFLEDKAAASELQVDLEVSLALEAKASEVSADPLAAEAEVSAVASAVKAVLEEVSAEVSAEVLGLK